MSVPFQRRKPLKDDQLDTLGSVSEGEGLFPVFDSQVRALHAGSDRWASRGVGLLVGAVVDAAADGGGYRVVFIVHAWIVPLGLKSRDSCRW
jgi:hypothetical protein